MPMAPARAWFNPRTFCHKRRPTLSANSHLYTVQLLYPVTYSTCSVLSIMAPICLFYRKKVTPVKSARLGQPIPVKRKAARPAKAVAAPASALPKPQKSAKKKNEVLRVCNTPNPKTCAIALQNIARRMAKKKGKDSSAILAISSACR